MKSTHVLYKFDGCPFCVHVMSYLKKNDINITMRDTMQDVGAREELISIGGKGQVPCLVIGGKPLYESGDIINYFEEKFV